MVIIIRASAYHFFFRRVFYVFVIYNKQFVQSDGFYIIIVYLGIIIFFHGIFTYNYFTFYIQYLQFTICYSSHYYSPVDRTTESESRRLYQQVYYSIVYQFIIVYDNIFNYQHSRQSLHCTFTTFNKIHIMYMYIFQNKILKYIGHCC